MNYNNFVLAESISQICLFIKQESLIRFSVKPARKNEWKNGNYYVLFYNK